MDLKLPKKERSKRTREAIIIVVASLLIVFLTSAQIRLMQLSATTTIGSNIIIFAVINIVILLVILLVYLVSRNVVKLLLENRSNPVATRLRTKLVFSFVGLSLVPTFLLFFVAAGFINNTVHNWFNNQVESALSESLEVAQTYNKNSAASTLYYGRQISGFIKSNKLINQENLPHLKSLVRQKQKEYNLGIVEVYSSQREELVRATNPAVPRGEFTSPSSEDIASGLSGKELTRVNPIGNAELIRGIVPIFSTWNERDVVGAVVVNYYVPYSLVKKMSEISSSYHEFRQLKILRNPIRTGYILTLFLITLVLVFFAYWMGVYLANSISKPVQELLEATRLVAEGRLDIQIENSSVDEIGLLVQSFNMMTNDLRTKQQALNSANSELTKINLESEQRRQYMEIVLRNVAAGVISVDKNGCITSINKSAEKLLNINTGTLLGRNFRELLQDSRLDIVKEILRDLLAAKKDNINRQIYLDVRGTRLALHLNVTMLRDESGKFVGTVLVLDDLTQVIKAQRMAAWREVARRIAHEIKNPLTPIQLSAQRLRKRYLSRFSNDEKVFDECTEMIIKSVDDLKNLVNEFSNFARMPSIQPEPDDLNEIIRETLTLYQQAHRGVHFDFVPDKFLPQLKVDRSQIKRVVINLLENAVFAMEEQGVITIHTNYDSELKMASFSISDNGPGISPEDKPRLFEPYFSTKKTGTGLGLAIANSVISDHNGFVRVRDIQPHGACFIVELPAG
jgi:two-component system nitrogen regulation sensor histidine kinase NtrY